MKKTLNHEALVALIRHGDYHQLENVPSALQPFPLSEKGAEEVRAQATQFAEMLNKEDWRLNPIVHSSVLLRAWQTAQIYIDTLKDFFDGPVEHLTSEMLSERSVGSVANLTIDEIELVIEADPRFETPPANWKSNSHYCLPFTGAESLLHAGQRVANYLTSNLSRVTAENNACQRVQLFVGHGASIRHAACHINVMKMEDINKFSMFHGHPIVMKFTQGEWRHIAGKWKVRDNQKDATD